MDHRVLASLFIGITLVTSTLVQAESTSAERWREGVHYERINGAPAEGSSKAIVVTEWFWLGCPHCDALEPHVVKWEKSLPRDVLLKRIPVAWDKPERVSHAKLYYAIEAVRVPALRQAAFDSIHRGKNFLFVPNERGKTLVRLRAFAQANGVDPESLVNFYSSPAADRYVEESNKAALVMHVPGVPSMSVNNRFTTDIARAGGAEPLLALVDHLIEKVRAGEAK